MSFARIRQDSAGQLDWPTFELIVVQYKHNTLYSPEKLVGTEGKDWERGGARFELHREKSSWEIDQNIQFGLN